jgi:hypothetical protein
MQTTDLKLHSTYKNCRPNNSHACTLQSLIDSVHNTDRRSLGKPLLPFTTHENPPRATTCHNPGDGRSNRSQLLITKCARQQPHTHYTRTLTQHRTQFPSQVAFRFTALHSKCLHSNPRSERQLSPNATRRNHNRSTTSDDDSDWRWQMIFRTESFERKSVSA